MKSLSECPIGSVVREKVENYEATVTSHQIHIDGCHRVVLQENRLKDGKPVPQESVDIQRVELVKRGNGPVMKPVDDIIGLKAKDIATGYTGVICIVSLNWGNDLDYLLQSDARKPDKDRVEAAWIQEGRLKLLEKRRVIKPQPEEPLKAGRGPVDAPLRAENPI